MTSNYSVTASLLSAIQEPEARELRAKIFAALADPTRLKIVELLAQNE